MAAKKAAKRAKGAKRASTAAAQVTTIVNGQVTGHITPGTGTIQAAVEQLARDNGLRSYSVRVNGVAIGPADALEPLAGNKTVEVFAKDTHG